MPRIVGNSRNEEKGKEQILPQSPWREGGPSNTFISDFRPPELLESTFLLCKAPQCVALRYRTHRKLTHGVRVTIHGPLCLHNGKPFSRTVMTHCSQQTPHICPNALLSVTLPTRALKRLVSPPHIDPAPHIACIFIIKL